MTVHRLAAEGFDAAGAAYERGRPSYPDEAVDLLATELGIGAAAPAAGPGRDVLDLAAGTGKLTRLLAPRGAPLVAVEPVAGMRRVLARLLPDVRVLDGTAERIPLPDASLDAVVVGQAFHWFDAPAAVAEIARVLRPDGRLGLIWNLRDETAPWVAQLTALLDRHAGDAPRYRDMRWRRAFGPLHERHFYYEQHGTLGTMRDRFASISFVACLPAPDRETLLGEIDALLRPHADPDGRVVMPYRTDVCWTPAGWVRSGRYCGAGQPVGRRR